MNLLQISNNVWRDLLSGKVECNFDFLALKILLTRLRMKIAKDASQATLDECIKEFKDYLEKMNHMPVVQKDIEKINLIRSMS